MTTTEPKPHSPFPSGSVYEPGPSGAIIPAGGSYIWRYDVAAGNEALLHWSYLAVGGVPIVIPGAFVSVLACSANVPKGTAATLSTGESGSTNLPLALSQNAGGNLPLIACPTIPQTPVRSIPVPPLGRLIVIVKFNVAVPTPAIQMWGWLHGDVWERGILDKNARINLTRRGGGS